MYIQHPIYYRGKYYKMASQTELDAFLSSPEKFVPPEAPHPLPPPELLPQRRSHANVKAMFPRQFEIQGFCPVSFVDGNKRYMLNRRDFTDFLFSVHSVAFVWSQAIEHADEVS